MRKFILSTIFAATVLATGLQAAFIPPSFGLIPGDISGAAGQQVGWGFFIYNNDETNWISITSLNPAMQTNASIMASFTDFLSPLGGPTDFALAPGDFWYVDPFDFGSQAGAAAYEIAADAALNAVDTGILRLGFDVFDGNPLLGANSLGSFTLDDELSPLYSVTVTTSNLPEPPEVPEPATWGMAALALGAAGVLRRKQK